MIFVEDGYVKVGGIKLPGLYKSIEIKTDALVEEKEVEGSSTKPKQATGYEDAKITIEILLDESKNQSANDKLETIQNIFRSSGQEIPLVTEIISEHTATRGINQVIFKSLTSKQTNKNNQLSVSLEFWEYIPVTITASATSSSSSGSTSSSSSASSSSNLNANYSSYLSSSRGTAPKISSKTAKTPAKDTDTYGRMSRM